MAALKSAQRMEYKILCHRDFLSLSGSVTFFPHGFAIKNHPHPEAHLGLALEGRYTELVRGKMEQCVPGVIRYLPANEPHSLRLAGSGRSLFVRIQPALVDRLRDYTAFDAFVGNVPGNTVSLSQQMYREFEEADQASPLAVECMVLELLIQMNRGRKLPGCKASPALLRARDFLHDCDNGSLRLEQIARQIGMHPVHLSREFHRVFGCTMSSYARSLKIQKAQTLLATSDLPLSEIGHLCGFHDQSHFSRSFKKLVGTTPLEYRRQMRP
jgi:AraC family transcriptional regulator